MIIISSRYNSSFSIIIHLHPHFHPKTTHIMVINSTNGNQYPVTTSQLILKSWVIVLLSVQWILHLNQPYPHETINRMQPIMIIVTQSVPIINISSLHPPHLMASHHLLVLSKRQLRYKSQNPAFYCCILFFAFDSRLSVIWMKQHQNPSCQL